MRYSSHGKSVSADKPESNTLGWESKLLRGSETYTLHGTTPIGNCLRKGQKKKFGKI